MSFLVAARKSAGSRCSQVGTPCMCFERSLRNLEVEKTMQVWRRRERPRAVARPAGPAPLE